MAQRNSPSRRIPGEPLAGILRTVAYQARYSNRRRTDVPTVTNAVASAASANAAATASVAAAAPESLADALARAELQQAVADAELQQVEDVATPVAAVAVAPALPLHESATLMMDGDGRATWQYEDRGTVPVVVATAVADQPAVATVSGQTATSVTLHVWDLSGRPVPGATACVAALWP